MKSHAAFIRVSCSYFATELRPVERYSYLNRVELAHLMERFGNADLAIDTDWEELPHTPFQHQLEAMDACYEARAWVGAMPFDQAWLSCRRPGWMAFLLERLELAEEDRNPWLDEYALRDPLPKAEECRLIRDYIPIATIEGALPEIFPTEGAS